MFTALEFIVLNPYKGPCTQIVYTWALKHAQPYIYIYMYIYIYVLQDICIYKYIHRHIYIYIHTYIHILFGYMDLDP